MNHKPELSRDEIQRLFKFVQSKYVHYRDVQYEIVDHLATAIEELQNTKPEKTFEQALAEVYARFPVTGFAQWMSEKEKQMDRYWSRRIGKWLLRYFKPPEVMITLGSTALIYFIIHLTGLAGILSLSLLIWIGVMILKRQSTYGKVYKNKGVGHYLVIESFYNSVPMTLTRPFWLTWIFIQSFNFGNLSFGIPVSDYIIVPLSFAFAVYSILIYAANFVFPYWLEAEIEEKYAHLEVPSA